MDPIGVAVRALREWLLIALPGAVTTVNSERAPVLRSAAGPFTVPAGARLVLRTDREATGTTCPLTAGTRTAAQVATDITAAAPSGITASSDTEGRVVLTGAAPSTTAPSLVAVVEDVAVAGSTVYAVGGNAALGWEPGGEYQFSSELRAPTWRGVTDGLPNVVPDMNQGFWVIIDDREARPTGGTSLRRHEWEVGMLLRVVKPELNNNPHRSREGVTAAVRAVLDSLLTTRGRYLGREANGDVMGLEVTAQNIEGAPLQFKQTPNVLHDSATISVTCRVFQIPVS